jgi:hypothetical protein
VKYFRQIVPIALAAGIAAAIACGDSSGPSGARAASVTGVAGDSQVSTPGSALAFPLSLVALGSNGQPIQGVTVTWTVSPAGSAIFAPASSPTDVNGVASTNVTLGASIGTLTISANVNGLSSAVVYHALVLNPCLFASSYTVGDTASGRLRTTDCNFQSQGWFYDFYGLVLPSGTQSLRIRVKSTVFDTYVDLFRDSDGRHMAFDDDSILGIVQDAQLDVILPGDTYVMGANSFLPGDTGSYILYAVPRPVAMNGCRQVWVVGDVTVADSITNSDCADSSATTKHYDVARVVIYSGTAFSIWARSSAVNPTLALYQINPNTYARSLIQANDDSVGGGTTTAYINYNPVSSGYYDILIGTSTGGETGAYTFELSVVETLSARRSPTATGREFWRGRSLLPGRAARPKL